jgi:hypothetical protein
VDHEELHGGAYGGPDRRDLQVPAREPHDVIRPPVNPRGKGWPERAEVTRRGEAAAAMGQAAGRRLDDDDESCPLKPNSPTKCGPGPSEKQARFAFNPITTTTVRAEALAPPL